MLQYFHSSRDMTYRMFHMAKVIVMYSLIICIGAQDSFFLHYKNPKNKLLLSNRLNNVILNEVKKGPIILEASQLHEFKPLVQSNVSRIVVSWNAAFRSFPHSSTIVVVARPREIKILLRKSLLSRSKYILVSESPRPLQQCFQAFWKYKILNVIAIIQSKFFHKTVEIFTYRPFSSRCGDTKPKLVGVRYDKPELTSLFPDLRKIKFNHCNLSFTVMDNIPDISISKEGVKIKGGLMKIFVAVRQHLEMGIRLWTGEEYWDPDLFAGSKWNGIPGYIWEVLKGRADFSLGRFSWMYHNHSGASFPMQVGMECITWAVPYGAGSFPSSWLLYTYQFNSLTWLLGFIAVLVAGAFMAFLEPRKRQPYLVVLRLLLANGSNKLPVSQSSRVFLVHWAIYSFVFAAAYQTSTGSLVLVPPESGNIETKEQLLASDLLLWTDVEMYKLSERLNFGTEFQEYFLLFPSDIFLDVIYRIYKKKDSAVLSSERSIKYAWNGLRRYSNDTHILSLLSQCLFTSPLSFFLVREGSYLDAPVHRSLRYLSEGGILQLWENVLEDEPTPRNFSQFKNNHPLSLHQTSGAFYILSGGYALASLTFILELFYKKKIIIYVSARRYFKNRIHFLN